MASYRDRFAQAIEQMGKQKDPTMAQYEAELMKPTLKNEAAPLVHLVDTFTGSNMAKQLPKEESLKDRLGQLLALRQGMENQKLKGLQALAGMEQDASDKAMQRAFQEKMYQLNLGKAMAKAQTGGKRKLGAEDIKAVSNIDMILGNIPAMKAALAKGNTLTPDKWAKYVSGDNDATRARRLITEAIGRLQSGGAIGIEEGDRFTAMTGGLMDDPEQVLAKLADLENEFSRRRRYYLQGPDDVAPMDAVSTSSAAPARTPSTGGAYDPNWSDDEVIAQARLKGWIQ